MMHISAKKLEKKVFQTDGGEAGKNIKSKEKKVSRTY